jgi:hypothetical protein
MIIISLSDLVKVRQTKFGIKSVIRRQTDKHTLLYKYDGAGCPRCYEELGRLIAHAGEDGVPKVSLGFWSPRTIGRAVGHSGEDGVPKVSLGFWSPRTIGRAVGHSGEDGVPKVLLGFRSPTTIGGAVGHLERTEITGAFMLLVVRTKYMFIRNISCV